MRLSIINKNSSSIIAIIFIAIIFPTLLTAQDNSGKQFSLKSAQDYAIMHNYDV